MVNQKLKCIIIDDESKGRKVLRNICEEYCPNVEIIGEADSVDSAEKMIKSLSPDFIFLDIRMPMKDGFQLLESLGKIDFHVIFTTAYEQYAVKAFKFSVVDYLLKPIDIDELIAAVEKIEKIKRSENGLRLQEQQKSNQIKDTPKIAFPTSDGYVFIDPDNIVRCTAYGNYTKFFVKGESKPVLVSKTLKYLDDLTEDYSFYRIHKSHMVNLIHVKRFVKGKPVKLIMTDGAEVEVSVRKREGLMEKLTAL